MVLGIVIYSVLVYFIDGALAANYHGSYTLFESLFPGGLYMSRANILIGLIFVVPLFFATKFGPWVGLACIVLGALIGDSLSHAITDFHILWYAYANRALLGFLSGLAFLRTQGVYNTRSNLATAIITSFIGIVVYALFYMMFDNLYSPSSSQFDLASVLASIGALIVLPILLLLYNKIEMRNAPTA